MNDQRLSLIVRSPQLVEAAVRSAVAESIAARRMRLGDIDARSFGIRALEKLRESREFATADLDALDRHQLEAATIAAAGRFFCSKLGRRIFTIDVARLDRTPSLVDASVRDSHGRRHTVRIETCASDAQRVELGRAIWKRADRKPGLHAPRVHLFSLRDGRLRSFTFAEHADRVAA